MGYLFWNRLLAADLPCSAGQQLPRPGDPYRRSDTPAFRHRVLVGAPLTRSTATAFSGRQRADADNQGSERPLGFRTVFPQVSQDELAGSVRRLVKRIDLGITDVVIHWRFSEDVCELFRSEVSPKARKDGDGGRVVEIAGV
jgi:hypothetical protein